MNSLYVFNIARLAVGSLLKEAAVHPKPGLVTPLDNGSHADMDFQNFIDSAMALLPCFLNCASIGLETLELGAEDVLGLLRVTGRQGEWEMLRATGGVNTHKGAIFLLGLLCAAAGRLAAQERESTPRALALTASSFVRGIVGRELADLTLERCRTAGERAFVLYGLEGVRGEAERGFPTALRAAGRMRELERNGTLSFRERAAHVLIHIVSENADCNLVARGGLDAMLNVQAEAKEILQAGGMLTPSGRAGIAEMERRLVSRNLSPGGSADILSAALFLEGAHACRTD
ncbi:triphosphoribosyl-dephospho-CoA synthase [Fretibacterium sp. OH1220_COT-178]|uniref:triphosphoribosyl-dephospho-CoA synthase n=1 Tax=Fretibacterium sp. OH1220_COT-178 TaxID=2491047 RepID=UPI000F5FE936|nr:triphosphoribosyl-dephospho-CoA synthase [Fretibacterium sp. OH1220_COT-178]RRD65305.1 triphosphoribosyl-dephospho-CoA synthase [Fretibacterium sp. OH1220_COT-178]